MMTEPTKIRVLLIDDSSAFLKSACAFLKRQPAVEVVGTAADGSEGLQKARELKPSTMLVDLNMPGIPGLQLLPMLRSEFPEAGLIVLTLFDGENNRTAALQAGADAFVCKARLLEELTPTIRQVAARHSGDTAQGGLHA